MGTVITYIWKEHFNDVVITKKLISMLSTKMPKSQQHFAREEFFSRPFYREPKIIKRTRFPYEFEKGPGVLGAAPRSLTRPPSA